MFNGDEGGYLFSSDQIAWGLFALCVIGAAVSFIFGYLDMFRSMALSVSAIASRFG